MKDQVLRIVKKVALIVGIFVVLALILHIPAVDAWLTDWIGSPLAREEAAYRIIIDRYEDTLPQTEAPYFYEEGGKLWLLQGGESGGPMDVTPEGVNVSFYASKHNITTELRTRRQCTLREDRKQILFLLYDHDIPTLFLTDLEADTTVKVATNVDSFLFVGDAVVYACGYTQSNQLYTYDAGVSELLATNVQSLALPFWNCVASLDQKGNLRLHDIEAGSTKKLASGVKEIYPESGKAVNMKEATVFCRKADGNYCVTASKTMKLQTNYLNEIYTSVGISEDGIREYLYCEAQGILACVAKGTQTHLFQALGNIQRIFSWDADREEFVVATQTGIYLLRPQTGTDGKSICLIEFEAELDCYHENPVMIREFLEVYRVGAHGFYVQSVSEDSFVLTESRPESWMNFLSSYLYGLSYVELNTSGDAVETFISCTVPASRSIEELLLRDDVAVFKSTYADDTVRSITTLKQGVVLAEDLLHTGHESKGQVEVVAQKIGEEIYFTLIPWGEKPEYSMLKEDGKTVSGIRHRIVSSMGNAYEMK